MTELKGIDGGHRFRRFLDGRGREIFRFGATGVAGFAVDAGLTAALMAAGLPTLLARAIAIVIAVATTFLIHRHWTFQGAQARGAFRQAGGHIAVQTFSLTLNYGVFALLLGWATVWRDNPVLAVAAGSAVGMFVSYALSAAFVFKARPTSQGDS